ncbi:hypothetical protein LTR72_005452 [Exophiala xenobiotica]|nr:hypothetical protein LTR72_005452 [Exophiala xenobiotica]KAK5297571.1 hypothetical protein LTR14_003302 [Exophiala xenobiotica]KAK5328792.1 hypothetical protein LTR93_002577 [Exophiala xenobiotica]KAK5382266.1 hypothetical protein LTS13_002930 [Exophiala xenobiotica]KAK5395925.1 hypothetical protein LTR79_006679 [Exophiala xenobiotica]
MSTQGSFQCSCSPPLAVPDATSDADYYKTNGALNFSDMVVDCELTLDSKLGSKLPPHQILMSAPDHDICIEDDGLEEGEISDEDDDLEEGEIREELGMFEITRSESAHSERSTVSSDGWLVYLEWYVNPKPAERDLIEVTAAELAKEHGCDAVFIRSNIHNTTRVQTERGRKRVLAPWHYTCDFRTREGNWRPSHVYTNTRVIQRATKYTDMVTKTTGLARRTPRNPDFYEETEYSHCNGGSRARAMLQV